VKLVQIVSVAELSTKREVTLHPDIAIQRAIQSRKYQFLPQNIGSVAPCYLEAMDWGEAPQVRQALLQNSSGTHVEDTRDRFLLEVIQHSTSARSACAPCVTEAIVMPDEKMRNQKSIPAIDPTHDLLKQQSSRTQRPIHQAFAYWAHR